MKGLRSNSKRAEGREVKRLGSPDARKVEYAEMCRLVKRMKWGGVIQLKGRHQNSYWR